MSTTMSQEASGAPSARPLNKEDYKTLGLSSLGGTLEFYDFVIYALYIETVVKKLFYQQIYWVQFGAMFMLGAVLLQVILRVQLAALLWRILVIFSGVKKCLH